MNIHTAIRKGELILKENKIKTATLDSQILMSKAINEEKKFIILNCKNEISTENLDYYYDLVNQRSNGKPIAYLLKKKNFWKNEFVVDKNVLIPRPDTETLVEQVLELTKNKNKLSLLDVGIGSGCILLSILMERKNFYGTGIDICKKSLEICRINSKKLGLNKRLKLIKSNIDNFHYGKYDLIVSNPPYIKKYDLKCLDKDVVGFEPKHALDGGVEGLSEIRKVINRSSELIKKKGFLILEIGLDQRNCVKRLLQNKGFYIKKIVKDLANHDRCIVGIKI
ncbi:peptide chain release factor N(5)-glutamine methyltransferase [Candidatus Pelagibacter sp. HIMB1483]|uniref:peptide chain release factor N(5)-glutamine methyltransferase n=1 Tax=Candidatus Pelagibacter sp. HIMB1483 TaxID=3415414 RepID=UPI003F847DF8